MLKTRSYIMGRPTSPCWRETNSIQFSFNQLFPRRAKNRFSPFTIEHNHTPLFSWCIVKTFVITRLEQTDHDDSGYDKDVSGQEREVSFTLPLGRVPGALTRQSGPASIARLEFFHLCHKCNQRYERLPTKTLKISFSKNQIHLVKSKNCQSMLPLGESYKSAFL